MKFKHCRFLNHYKRLVLGVGESHTDSFIAIFHPKIHNSLLNLTVNIVLVIIKKKIYLNHKVKFYTVTICFIELNWRLLKLLVFMAVTVFILF